MAIFSTNQNRQLYVVSGTNGATAAKGDIKLVAPTNGDAIYFQHVGEAGITRSDRIDVKNIISAQKKAAADLGIRLKRAKIISTLDEPVVGEDYIMNIKVSGGDYGNSPEDTQTIIASAKGGASNSILYRDLALSLMANKGIDEMVTVYLETLGRPDGEVATTTKVKHTDTVKTLVGTYTGIVIEALDANADCWALGRIDVAVTDFSVSFATIGSGKDEKEWGKVFYVAPDPTHNLKNGKLIAQLEYFCMGERADQYRNFGYPYVTPSKLMVNSTLQYDVIDIHYAYVGSNESVQKSEKTITLVFPTGNSAQLSAFIEAWNAVAGVPQLA